LNLLRARKFADATVLEDFLTKVRAARDWQLKNFDDMTTTRLAEAYKTLNPNSAEEANPLPVEHRALYTSKVAKEFLQASHIDEWAFTTQPYLEEAVASLSSVCL
jgi:hypothetical protein